MNIIEIKDLTFRYGRNFIFDNFNLNIEKGSWVTISGPNGSGKTTLIKILSYLQKSTANIKIFNKRLNKKNALDIRKDIGFVFDTPENYFACETVEDELAFSLENMAIQPATIKKKIEEITNSLNLKSLLKENPLELSGGEKQKVAIACALILEPRILVFDDSFMMIDNNEKEKILKLLKDYNNKKGVTILSFSNNLEEMLYSDRLIVLNDGKIILDGSYPYVFEEERVMRKLGLDVPFMIELSQKLKLFGLIDDLYLDKKRLVNKLWK